MSIYVDLIGFDTQREFNLRERLTRLHRGGATMSYYQLQGLLFAMACSPERIKTAEWFDLLWLDDEPQFDDATEARAFYRSVVSLADQVADQARRQQFLPFGEDYDGSWLPELGEWCEGFLVGHHYLEDLWLITLDDLDDQRYIEDVEAVINLAATFADAEQEEAHQLSFEGELELPDAQLADAYTVFRRVLATYATAGSLWAEHSWNFDAEQLFLSLEPVPRESLCPCGSGQIFAKCCLH